MRADRQRGALPCVRSAHHGMELGGDVSWGYGWKGNTYHPAWERDKSGNCHRRRFMSGLRYGSDELNLVRLDDRAFQNKMKELDEHFQKLQKEIRQVRKEGRTGTAGYGGCAGEEKK